MKAAAQAAAVSPAFAKTNHKAIKEAMLEVLAVVMDIQKSYEAYERPSEVNHEVLEPIWRARLENAFATNVAFETTPNRGGYKYLLCVRFTLTVGACNYTLQAIGTDAPKGFNSTAEWIRDVTRWPDSEKAMEKKGVKAPVEPRSLGHGATMKQESIDELQGKCAKQVEDAYRSLVDCAVQRFITCKFDGRAIRMISRESVGFTLWFKEPVDGQPNYLQLQGNFETFEFDWLPRFTGSKDAAVFYRADIARAHWVGKWIDGMVKLNTNPRKKQIMDQQPPVVETVQPLPTTPEPEKSSERGQLTAAYYLNPKTGLTKSFLVKGDTLPLKDRLKDLGGTWCAGLGGWIFGLKREHQFKAEFPAAQWIAQGSTQARAA